MAENQESTPVASQDTMLATIQQQLATLLQTVAHQQSVIERLQAEKTMTAPAAETPVVAPSGPMVEITNESLNPLRIPLSGGATPKFLDLGPAQTTEENDTSPRGMLPRAVWDRLPILQHMAKPGKNGERPVISVRFFDGAK